MPSHFAFIFRFRPLEHCLHLNFDRKELAPRFGAVCVRDRLGIFWIGELTIFDEIREYARHLALSLVHSHAYCSYPDGTLLEVAPDTWLEFRHGVAREAVFGNMDPSCETSPLQPGHPDNEPMLRAVDLARLVYKSSPLQLALADFYAARREPVPYYAFYAYRVLEDIGYMFGVTKSDRPDWDAMNAALKTEKKHWDVLEEAGTRARHLNEQKLQELAKANRPELLTLSHDAIKRAIEHVGNIAGQPSVP